MKSKDRKRLLEGLAQYGYSLLEPVSTYRGEDLLKDLLREDDPRLLEGFPVVLVNLFAEKQALGWEGQKWDPKRHFSGPERARLVSLVVLSYLLLKLFGLDSTQVSRLEKLLAKLSSDWKKRLATFEAPFLESRSVPLDSKVSLSTERLKTQFRNYAVQGEGSKEVGKKRRELELELLLSEFFTPRQKELLTRRLRGEPFTKTEREYFYRVVRKRLKALASDELHQFARSAVLK